MTVNPDDAVSLAISSMTPEKKEHPEEKSGLHPRNKHRERYDFKKLIVANPDLMPFVRLNEYKDESIDFFNPEAVKQLNKALLKHFYHLDYWDIPRNYLCPPIPGRADYIHHVADLLAGENTVERDLIIPTGSKISCLDIGVGANCVYPIIGKKSYGWSFVGADIDPVAVASAQKILDMNAGFGGAIKCRLQPNPKDIFKGIIQEGERFDVTICNPPFHSSAEEAEESATRKLSNLKRKRITQPVLNFGGKSNELWCEGGERRFITDMIDQSKHFKENCLWFTTLISKGWNLNNAHTKLQEVGALEVKTIPMSHGNKASRVVAWTFLNGDKKKLWVKEKWT
jgi:23S rRNA (adenine1618-N6)-methyltransferase